MNAWIAVAAVKFFYESIAPPWWKGLETRLERDGLVWATGNKPLNL